MSTAITVSPLHVWADFNELGVDCAPDEIWVSLTQHAGGAFVQIGDPINLHDHEGLTARASVVSREGVGVLCKILDGSWRSVHCSWTSPSTFVVMHRSFGAAS